MAIPSFPIPEQKPTVQQVDERLQLQSDVLEGLYATAQSAVDQRIDSQTAVLGGLANTALRTVDKRIRAQSKLLEPVVSSAVAAVDDAIARQGAQLAIHQEVFPRTYPAPQDTPSSLGPAYAPFSISPTGATSQPGTGQSSAAPGNTQGNGSVGTYAILCDCAAKSLGVYLLTDPVTLSRVATGSFVPIRYGTNDRIMLDFLTMQLGRPLPNQANIISVACHAYEHDGDGWPYNGDFYPDVATAPNHGQGLPAVGQAVGDWPFPR